MKREREIEKKETKKGDENESNLFFFPQLDYGCERSPLHKWKSTPSLT